jgi:signal transduction histidine kinase/CheY-like chemotaxis protein
MQQSFITSFRRYEMKKRIMIVDDSSANAAILNLSLKEAGYEVTGVFSSGEQAIESVERCAPDIILMDIVLTEHMSGIQAADIISSNHKIPVIFITGSSDDSIIREMLSKNPYGFIQKPYKTSMLCALIEIALQRKDMEQMLMKSQEKLRLSTQVLELLNIAENREQAISDILFIIKSMTGIDEISIFFKDGGVETSGMNFSSADISSAKGKIPTQWYEVIDTISELISSGEIDRSRSFFTPKGAFWTNNLSQDAPELFKRYPSADIDFDILEKGYSAVALIPLYSDSDHIGTLRLFSAKKNEFSYDDMIFFERISASIGVTLSRNHTQSKLKNAYLQLRKLDQIVNKSPVVTFNWEIKENKRHPLFVSESIAGLGYTPEDFYSGRLKFCALIHPDDLSKIYSCNIDLNNDDKDYMNVLTYRFKNSKNEYRWVDDYLWKEEGENSGRNYQGVMVDVTNQVNANMVMQENKAFMDAVLKGIKAAIIIVDPETRSIRSMNDEAQKLLQFDDENFLNCPIELCPAVSDIFAAQQPSPEILIEHSDGTKIPAGKIVLEIVWKRKPHKAVILFDISEQKNLERQLSIAQKLESIGSLAAGIAHEINTPIQYIGDNARFLMQSFGAMLEMLESSQSLATKSPADADFAETFSRFSENIANSDLEFFKEEVPAAIDQSIEGVDRVASIVRAMKKFSHPGREDKQPVDINNAIENTITIARNEWKYYSEVVTNFDTELPYVPCYPGDFNQVILNLLVNAAQAIESKMKDTGKKGEINISTQYLGKIARVVIKDNGGGIAEEIRHKVFDPFFTTKDIGKGTGQGLAIAHQVIVKKHSGRIYFEVEKGVGTSFIVEIPIETESEPEQSQMSASENLVLKKAYCLSMTK